MNSKPTILVVDDDKLIHALIGVMLKNVDADILRADDGCNALEIAREQCPSLILLDIDLPDISGFEICKTLAEDSDTADIPVIFLTGTDDTEVKVAAYKQGAIDYVVKPFNSDELRARVTSVLRTQTLIAQLETQATTDALTGLPNRQAFASAVDEAIIRVQKNDSRRFAVLILDLDHFKTINDSLGHDVGDKLLRHVANKLREGLSQVTCDSDDQNKHIVARMGGDEFMIMLDPIRDLEQAVDIGQFLVKSLASPFIYHGHDIITPVSIGARIWDADCESADTLLRDGDVAMYYAKSAGRNRCVGFTPQMHSKALERFQIERDLRDALRKQQFILKYQPVVSLETGKVFSFEVLIYWDSPQRGLLSPDQFIPIAEEIGIIEPLGKWMMGQACQQLSYWQQRFENEQSLALSINVSKKQLTSPDFIDQMHTILVGHKVRADSLLLEISEASMMDDVDATVEALNILQQAPIQLCMDDFGTGQSSLVYLHRFPIDVLKIDPTFISNMNQDRAYTAIVHAVTTLAHNLNMKVIAQGIETPEQLAQLQALECDYAQGQYFSKPVSADVAETFLTCPPRMASAG